MIARLAWHEVRQQVGGRVFWIVFSISVLMVAGAMLLDELRVGLPDEGARTGAAAILRTHLVWSLFFLFTAAALVGEAVLRDEMNGFADLVRATPVSRRHYVLARFIGATVAVLLCFTSVPLALAAAGAGLGYGAGPAESYLFAFFALALPDLLLASALFFMLAAVTRSMTGCLLGAAGLLTLYGLAGESGALALIDPFGFAAIKAATRGWSVAQRDTQWPALTGVLLANRLLWLLLAAALIELGSWLAAQDRVRSRRTGSPAMPVPDDTGLASIAKRENRTPRFEAGWKVVAVQLLVRTSFEVRCTILTPAFAVLLLMGLAAAVSAASKVDGTPATISVLATSFQLVPVVVILFFVGELFWAEREHNVAPIVAVTPASEAVLVMAKLLALALVLLSLAIVSAGAGAGTEIVKGHSPAPSLYLAWYVLPQAYDWLLLGALALFLQSIAPNKLAGWGYMVFYLIGSLALDKLGLRDPHYRYGAYPGVPLPPALSGAQDVGWYRLGWGLIGAMMAAVACKRGLARAAGRQTR